MVRVDRLLQFISQLQSEESSAQRRLLLLRYIRELTESRFVALFLLDEPQQRLTFLAHSGKRPGPEPSTRTLSTTYSLPLTGLFGAALLTQGFLALPDLQSDPQSLPEEREWSWPGGPVLLSAVRESSKPGSTTGLLLLAFPATKENELPGKSSTMLPASVEYEGELLVCITLLSAYLSLPEEGSVPPRLRHEKPIAYDELDRAMSLLLRNRRSEQQGTLPELLYSLSSITELYEIGLLMGSDIEIQELYQHILSSLSHVVLAQGSCLLLYEAPHQHFVSVASLGRELPYDVLARSLDSHEMERLALRGPGETIAPIMLGQQHVLLVTLSCNCLLLGIVTLVIMEPETGDDVLVDERGLLLSYMGNIAALLLKNYELRSVEVHHAIEQERNRIARDLHDGPMQNITHILHRLENIQYLLDTQSATTQEIILEVKRAAHILDTSLYSLRHDIASLLPMEVEEHGFVAALEALIDEYRQNNPPWELSFQAEIPLIQVSTLQSAIFRCIQEALNNIRKHAHAHHISIQMHVVQNMLLLEISDDGVGFSNDLSFSSPTTDSDHPKSANHLGLRSMEARLKSVGGIVEIESHTGSGTLLKASFPLPQQTLVLTNREREILRFVSQGMNNSDIALKLLISRETVKSHIYHIMRKMHVHDRTQAAVIAVRQGML